MSAYFVCNVVEGWTRVIPPLSPFLSLSRPRPNSHRANFSRTFFSSCLRSAPCEDTRKNGRQKQNKLRGGVHEEAGWCSSRVAHVSPGTTGSSSVHSWLKGQRDRGDDAVRVSRKGSVLQVSFHLREMFFSPVFSWVLLGGLLQSVAPWGTGRTGRPRQCDPPKSVSCNGTFYYAGASLFTHYIICCWENSLVADVNTLHRPFFFLNAFCLLKFGECRKLKLTLDNRWKTAERHENQVIKKIYLYFDIWLSFQLLWLYSIC